MNEKATTANTYISEIGSTESNNPYIRIVPRGDAIQVNPNKPWRIVIRRQVIDGGDNNENIP